MEGGSSVDGMLSIMSMELGRVRGGTIFGVWMTGVYGSAPAACGS